MSVIVKVRYKKKGVMVGVASNPLWMHDYGQQVTIMSTNIPDGAITVYFAREKAATSTPAVGIVSDGDLRVTVPNEMLDGTERQNYVIDCYCFAVSSDTGTTEYYTKILVAYRQQPEGIEPTPVQKTAIEQAIEALNNAIDHTDLNVELAQAAQAAAETSAGNSASSAEESARYAHDSSLNATAAAGSAAYADEQAREALAQAMEAARQAGLSANSASASASSARDSSDSANRAEQAAARGGWMLFEIKDGRLYMERTSNIMTDFVLEDGHLIMEAVG